MSPADIDNQRANQVSLLWSFKRAVDALPPGSIPGIKYIHFNLLCSDESYRANILEKALTADNPEVQSLAEQILNGGTVHTLADKIINDGYQESPGVSDSKRTAPPRMNRRPAGDDDMVDDESPVRHRQAGVMTAIFALAAALLAGLGYFATKSGLIEQIARVNIGGGIVEDTVWKSGNVYVLNGMVFVEGNATLTIEPGAKIIGKPGSALIVTRDAHIHANGEPQRPIVFTSAKPVGQRAAGDWGGVVLLGNAPVNEPSPHIEGIDREDPRGSFGGSNESDSCGTMKYVRIEFAGYEISKDNELNGLTLGGCGNGTIIRYLQVHMGLDDGIEFFGGSPLLSNIVITRPGDDGFDWDRGFHGKAQFVIIQQGPNEGDNGIEADNWVNNNDAEPRSNPTLSNFTIISGGNIDQAQRGMTLRRGTAGDIRNTLIAGFTTGAIDIRDKATVEQIKQGNLHFESMVITEAVKGTVFESETTAEEDDDNGFDEEAFFLNNPNHSIMYVPRQLLSPKVHDLTDPNFAPSYGAELSGISSPIPQGEFWDEAANYVGAIRPGTRTTWLEGWTAFPED